MSLKRIESLIKKLRDRSYQPHPARRQYIPKKSGNGLRPLGIRRQTTNWYKKPFA